MALKHDKIQDITWCKTSRRTKKWLKRDMTRWMRRKTSEDIENAPTKKQYRGWSI